MNISLSLEKVSIRLQQTFEDSTAWKEFTNTLSKQKESFCEIVKHTRSSFAKLYINCKSMKTSETYTEAAEATFDRSRRISTVIKDRSKF